MSGGWELDNGRYPVFLGAEGRCLKSLPFLSYLSATDLGDSPSSGLGHEVWSGLCQPQSDVSEFVFGFQML